MRGTCLDANSTATEYVAVTRAPRVPPSPPSPTLPLGLLAFALGMAVAGAVDLGWVPGSGLRSDGYVLLTFVAPLQLLAATFAFAGREPFAGTALAMFGANWLTVGAQWVTATPAPTHPTLALFGFTFSALIGGVACVATRVKPILSVLMALAATRGVLSATGQVHPDLTLQRASGALAVAVAVLMAAVALRFLASVAVAGVPVAGVSVAGPAAPAARPHPLPSAPDEPAGHGAPLSVVRSAHQ